MGKGIFKLNWLVVAVIFAFILSAINTVMIKQKFKMVICTVDIWQISNDMAMKLSTQSNIKTLDGLAKNEDIRKEVDSYMQIIRQKVSSPEQYGCDYIAVKGSVFGKNMKDVTEQVIKGAK